MTAWTLASSIEPVELDATPEIAPGHADFRSLYRSTLPEVYSYLANRCRSRSVAEDLTQEVFLAAAGMVRDGRGGDVTVAWLITVARNKLVDHLRREGRAERVLARAGSTPDDDLESWLVEPSCDHAVAALDMLPGDQRLALVLRYLDGMAVQEVAATIGRSVHATESLLARARAAFKRAYQEAAHV